MYAATQVSFRSDGEHVVPKGSISQKRATTTITIAQQIMKHSAKIGIDWAPFALMKKIATTRYSKNTRNPIWDLVVGPPVERHGTDDETAGDDACAVVSDEIVAMWSKSPVGAITLRWMRRT